MECKINEPPALRMGLKAMYVRVCMIHWWWALRELLLCMLNSTSPQAVRVSTHPAQEKDPVDRRTCQPPLDHFYRILLELSAASHGLQQQSI